MKKVIICAFLLAGSIWLPFEASAGNCYSDSIVSGWVDRRDRVERRVLQAWAQGALPGELASDIAMVLSDEFYICSKCRDDADFLKDNLHILNGGSGPKVETVPSMILERLVGYMILSPWRQFPDL